jgi:DNA-binding HxlR family transcriptional regulator
MTMDNKIENCNPNEEYYQSILTSVSDTLYAIGGKWKLKIIISLFNGTKRFNDLQRTVTGISAKVLSNELKELELNGFVKRKVNTEAFVVVIEYELTDYSFTLNDVVMALSNWGSEHRNYVKKLI